MTEADGWREVYQAKRPKVEQPPQVCFTGFSLSQKETLIALAQAAGLRVVQSVTKKLSFLCIGESPGPAKLRKAQSQNITLVDEQQFKHLLRTGELPG